MSAPASMLVLLLAVVGLGQAQLIPDFLSFGFCSEVAPQANFDAAKFAGRWFTLERVPNQYVETDSCVYANYTAVDGSFKVKEFGKDSSGKDIQLVSTIRKNGVNEPFTVISEGVPEAPLKVIATDYDTYACLQSCINYVAFKAEFAWILTKKPAASAQAIKTCRQVMTEKVEFDVSQFQKVQQGRGCVYTH